MEQSSSRGPTSLLGNSLPFCKPKVYNRVHDSQPMARAPALSYDNPVHDLKTCIFKDHADILPSTTRYPKFSLTSRFQLIFCLNFSFIPLVLHVSPKHGR